LGGFIATLHGLLANYDDVHVKSRHGGEWTQEDSTGKIKGRDNAEEWASVELYMGLFEFCERLLKQRLMNYADFEQNLRYRLANIVANPVIVNSILESSRGAYWGDFVKLCDRSGVKIVTAPQREKGEVSTMTDSTNRRGETTTPRRPWSEDRAAVWGAGIAGIVNIIQQIFSPHISSAETFPGLIAGHVSEVIGAALMGALLFAIGAALINLVTGKGRFRREWTKRGKQQ